MQGQASAPDRRCRRRSTPSSTAVGPMKPPVEKLLPGSSTPGSATCSPHQLAGLAVDRVVGAVLVAQPDDRLPVDRRTGWARRRSRGRRCSARGAGTTTAGSPVSRSRAKMASVYSPHPSGELGQLAVPTNTSSRLHVDARRAPHAAAPAGLAPSSGSKYHTHVARRGVEGDDAGARSPGMSWPSKPKTTLPSTTTGRALDLGGSLVVGDVVVGVEVVVAVEEGDVEAPALLARGRVEAVHRLAPSHEQGGLALDLGHRRAGHDLSRVHRGRGRRSGSASAPRRWRRRGRRPRRSSRPRRRCRRATATEAVTTSSVVNDQSSSSRSTVSVESADSHVWAKVRSGSWPHIGQSHPTSVPASLAGSTPSSTPEPSASPSSPAQPKATSAADRPPARWHDPRAVPPDLTQPSP